MQFFSSLFLFLLFFLPHFRPHFVPIKSNTIYNILIINQIQTYLYFLHRQVGYCNQLYRKVDSAWESDATAKKIIKSAKTRL